MMCVSIERRFVMTLKKHQPVSQWYVLGSHHLYLYRSISLRIITYFSQPVSYLRQRTITIH
jgi:hypothetical protein